MYWKIIKRTGLISILLMILFLAVKFLSGYISADSSILKNLPIISSGSRMNKTRHRSEIEEALHLVFDKFEVNENEIEETFFLEDSLKEINVKIPRGKPVENIVWQIQKEINSTSYSLTESRIEDNGSKCIMQMESNKNDLLTIRLTITRSKRYFSNTSRIAFIIENFNFKADKTTINILSFPQPLSISLMPDNKNSSWTAQAASEYKKEVLIQIPLEPSVYVSREYQGTMIMVHYPENRIRGLIENYVKDIPNFSGFINFMGSRALNDSRIVQILFKTIKERHGYFVEKSTGHFSLGRELAEKISIPYTAVDFTINEDKNVDNIRKEINHVCVLSHKVGTITVSAPASHNFITTLNTMLPEIKNKGIKLVYASNIVKEL